MSGKRPGGPSPSSEKRIPVEAEAVPEGIEALPTPQAEEDAAQQAAPEAAEEAAQEAAEEGDPGPDEQLRAKFREAMAHKHGAAGAGGTSHGDHGSYGHSVGRGPSQRMFRRKAGG